MTGDLQHHASAVTRPIRGSRRGSAAPRTRSSRPRRGRPSPASSGRVAIPHDEFAGRGNRSCSISSTTRSVGRRSSPRTTTHVTSSARPHRSRPAFENVAIQSLSQLIDIANEPGVTPIVVFNPLAWPVRSLVELEYGGLKPNDGLLDEEGRPVAFQQVQSYATVSSWRSRLAFEAEVPALGYRTYAMTAGKRQALGTALRATSVLLENDFLRLELDPATGRTVHLVLREDGRDVADLRMAHVRARSSSTTRPTPGATDDLPTATRSGRSRRRASSWSNPARSAGILRVNSRYGDSVLTEDFVVSANRDTIEQRVILDWREKAQMLKIRMRDGSRRRHRRLRDPVRRHRATGRRRGGARATLDRCVGNDRRRRRTLRSRGPERREVRLRHPRRRVGRHCRAKPDLRPSRADRPTEGVRYQFQDQGLQRFTLWLVPHRGDWRDGV